MYLDCPGNEIDMPYLTQSESTHQTMIYSASTSKKSLTPPPAPNWR